MCALPLQGEGNGGGLARLGQVKDVDGAKLIPHHDLLFMDVRERLSGARVALRGWVPQKGWVGGVGWRAEPKSTMMGWARSVPRTRLGLAPSSLRSATTILPLSPTNAAVWRWEGSSASAVVLGDKKEVPPSLKQPPTPTHTHTSTHTHTNEPCASQERGLCLGV